jgi:hypothetical protein
MPPSALKFEKFECRGKGLLFAGNQRESPTGLKFALGILTLGRILPGGGEKIIKEKYPKTWWEAQVRLYGLKCSKWTVENMKQVLCHAVEAGIEVSEEVKELEERLNKEYAELEKENKSPKATDNRHPTSKKTALAPQAITKTINSADAGQKPSPILDARSINNPSRAKQLATINRLHSALLDSGNEGTTIFGTWQLDCPDITTEWCHNEDLKQQNIIWKIHPPQVHDSHLWVGFKQIIVEGVLRIQWKSALERNNWKNRKNTFTFRGRETGEGELLCDDDVNKGWIIFTSSHECHGEFECQFGEKPWSFTGKKVNAKVTGKHAYTLLKDYERYEREWRKTAWFI